MKQYQITLNGRTFDVRLLSDPLKEQVEVEVDGETFTVQVKSARVDVERDPEPLPTPSTRPQPAAVARQPLETAAPSGKAVTAPLPGVIKSIAIRPGQQVSAGDPLLVIEAMKMDNVLRAGREGIVETIHAVEGRQVAHGELLLEYRT